jgi:hypothetical protein
MGTLVAEVDVATIKAVAKRAGVSPSTVSYVLSGARPIGEATRRRVLEAIEELDYHRNSSAIPHLISGVAIGFIFLFFFQPDRTLDTVLKLLGAHWRHLWLGDASTVGEPRRHLDLTLPVQGTVRRALGGHLGRCGPGHRPYARRVSLPAAVHLQRVHQRRLEMSGPGRGSPRS